MRDDGRESCLRVLCLGPTATTQEIKAAYRDLAKVWHPDRFAHDPRLQQKAQEQLKEINEAYRRLAASDHPPPHAHARGNPKATYEPPTPRAADAQPRATPPDAAHDRPPGAQAAATADGRVATRPPRRVNRLALAAPALAFCATFAYVTPRLLSTGRAPTPADEPSHTAPAPEEHGKPASTPTNSEAATKRERTRQADPAAARQQATRPAESMTAPSAQPLRALPTVTVSIDPTTGLRARASCPNKSAMTFPAGDAPSAYCDAAHNTAPPQRAATGEARAGKTDGSRLKSFAGRLASPAKKLFGGTPDKQPSPGKAARQD